MFKPSLRFLARGFSAEAKVVGAGVLALGVFALAGYDRTTAKFAAAAVALLALDDVYEKDDDRNSANQSGHAPATSAT